MLVTETGSLLLQVSHVAAKTFSRLCGSIPYLAKDILGQRRSIPLPRFRITVVLYKVWIKKPVQEDVETQSD